MEIKSKVVEFESFTITTRKTKNKADYFKPSINDTTASE